MQWAINKALLGHYRKRPFQVLFIWFGLTLGIALMVSVMAVNYHAQQSYARGEKIFSTPLPYRIQPRFVDKSIPLGLFGQLRESGFHQCVPINSIDLKTKNHKQIQLVGIDPIAMMMFNPNSRIQDQSDLVLMKSPYPVVMTTRMAHKLSVRDGEYIQLENHQKLGPVLIDHSKKISNTRLVADIVKVDKYTHNTSLSMIACGAMPPEKAEKLREILPSGLYITKSSALELTALTKAFHMNLTALGMLSFLVGVFIFYQAISLSFSQRQPMVGALRLLGVTRSQIVVSVLFEISIWVLLSWGSGNVLGLFIANILMPNVAATLSDLYNASVETKVIWQWSWAFYSLGLILIACFISSIWPLIRLLKSKPIHLSMRLTLSRLTGVQFAWEAVLGCFLIVLIIALMQRPTTQENGFIIIGLILISVGLLVPYIMWGIFNLFSQLCSKYQWRCFFLDCASSMSFRGVGAMAFLLAISTNIGIQTVVTSFKSTTEDWLKQRLAADIYVTPSKHIAPHMVSWLEKQPEVSEVWWRWEKELTSNNEVIQIVSSGRSQGEKDALLLKDSISNYWQRLHSQSGILISESMAMKHHIQVGDELLLPEPLGKGWDVLGIYYDYGNPYGQIILSEKNWTKLFKTTGNVGLSIVLDPSVDSISYGKKVQDMFNLSDERIYNNGAVFQNAMSIFDKAFIVAKGLSLFTLIVALISLFFATVIGELAKRNQFALVRSFGVTARELVLQGAMQLFVMGIILISFSLPLGIGLAALLNEYVLSNAFGWSMSLQVHYTDYFYIFGVTLLALFIVGGGPIYIVLKALPAKLFQGAH